MDSISGGDFIGPELKAIYKQEFAHGVDLFQRCLAEYQKTEENFKKAKFKEVMDEALGIMNETAKALVSKKLAEYKSQLEADFREFKDNDAPEICKKLNADLEHLKKAL